MGLFNRTPALHVTEARALQQAGSLLVDVREKGEFRTGHAPGAVNVPLSNLATITKHAEPDTPLLVICRSGHRSGVAARKLRKLGYGVSNVGGGMLAWHGAGLPVRKPTRNR